MFEIIIYDEKGSEIDYMTAHDLEDARWAAELYTPADGGNIIRKVA